MFCACSICKESGSFEYRNEYPPEIHKRRYINLENVIRSTSPHFWNKDKNGSLIRGMKAMNIMYFIDGKKKEAKVA